MRSTLAIRFSIPNFRFWIYWMKFAGFMPRPKSRTLRSSKIQHQEAIGEPPLGSLKERGLSGGVHPIASSPRSSLPPVLMQRNWNGRSCRYSATEETSQTSRDYQPALLGSARLTEQGGWSLAPNFGVWP